MGCARPLRRRCGLDLAVAREAAEIDDREIARRLVDVDVPRAELVRLSRGLTPARLARVIAMLDPVELMFALKKLRARRAPANQAHVTNLKENPALLAADAAEAAARGFAEIETTVGVSRYAPLNAIAILVGSQTGRPGVMTQCAVEERLNLRLAMLGPRHLRRDAVGLRHRAGLRRRRRHALVEGVPRPPPTPRAASRCGSPRAAGSEALMGESEGKSMLYLEARCLSLVRAAGSQGVQNGSISCVALALAVPGGTREVLAENVLAAWLDLEVASGNDAIASHSEIRKTAKLMGQFLPGTDFVTSGYSAMPRYDNMFGGGNYDSDDLDEWLTLQRDWQVDAGIEPLDEESALAIRERGARAIQAVFDAFGFPPITDEEVRLATTCLDSRDLPDRDRAADVARRRPRPRSSGSAALDVARGARRRGFRRRRRRRLRDAAAAGRRRLPPDLGDHRRPTARSSRRSTTPTATPGPGTGYRLEGERWERLQRLPHAVDARLLGRGAGGASRRSRRSAARCAATRPTEVVIAVGPAFGAALSRDDRRPLARRRARRARRRASATEGGPAPRPDPALLRRRLHRPRRREARRLRRRDRPPVEGDGGDPPRRPRAPRQPRALRDGAVADARVVPPDRPQRRRLRARPPRRAGADGDRQLRAGEADRPHDPAARARDRRGRARRARRSSSRRSRPRSAPRTISQPLGFPATPQWVGETPWTSTWMCSRAAPEDSASAAVIASMIFGTDSSVTRLVVQLDLDERHSAPSFVPRFRVAAPAVRRRDPRRSPRCAPSAPARPAPRAASRSCRSISFDSSSGVNRRSNSSTRTSGISCSTCCAPPSGPSTRSRSWSGTWSSGTGASASMKVTPALGVELVLRARG